MDHNKIIKLLFQAYKTVQKGSQRDIEDAGNYISLIEANLEHYHSEKFKSTIYNQIELISSIADLTLSENDIIKKPYLDYMKKEISNSKKEIIKNFLKLSSLTDKLDEQFHEEILYQFCDKTKYQKSYEKNFNDKLILPKRYHEICLN